MPAINQSSANGLRPAWQSADGSTVKIYQGDSLDVLRRLPSRTAQCCITSPPYWGLRDYQTGEWTGGDPACDHLVPRSGKDGRSSTLKNDGRSVEMTGHRAYEDHVRC